MNFNVEYNINQKGDQYVGITLDEKNKVKVCLPIGYNYIDTEKESKDLKKEIRTLFKLLAIKQNNGYIKNDSINEFNLVSAIKVIENYMEYGLYKQTEKRTSLNSNGKIDWQKTIHSKQIYIKDKIIYNNIYTMKLNYNAEKEIQNIQKICLNQICKIIGIYWGIFINEEVKEMYGKNKMINILQAERKNLNQDKKIEMINNLLDYLKGANFDKINKKDISFKYKEFEYIWQNLIDIEGVRGAEKSKYQPIAEYCNFDGSIFKNVAPTLPDTIIIDDKNKIAFILDAKYYKIGNLPNENDIFKQVRYGEYLKNILDDEGKEDYKIINSFILPDKLPKESVVVQDYYANLKDNKIKLNKDNSNRIIFVTYVDTKSLINNTKHIVHQIQSKLMDKYNQIF